MNTSGGHGGGLVATGMRDSDVDNEDFVSLTIGESEFIGNVAAEGGGVADLHLKSEIRSTWFTANQASVGAGLLASGEEAYVNASTFSSNVSSGNGGGVATNSDHLILVNTTLSQNTAAGFGGGLWHESGDLSLGNNTIVRNQANSDGDATGDGGGLSVAGTATEFVNNLVAGNRRGIDGVDSSSDILVTSAVSIGGTNNLVGDPNSAGGVTNSIVGDESGNEWSLDRLIFRELSENLGGFVPVHPLKIDSPAIDAGADVSVLDSQFSFNVRLTSDARVYPFARADKFGGETNPTDIGAFEVQFQPLTSREEIVVSTTIDESDGDFSFGDLSLREAILLANVRADPSVIRFDRSILPDEDSELDDEGNPIPTKIVLDGVVRIKDPNTGEETEFPAGPLKITRDLLMSGGDQIVISGADNTGILEVGSMATVDISGITFKSGKAERGGAIYNQGTLSLSDATFVGNRSIGTSNSSQGGGAIYNEGSLTIRDSVLAINDAVLDGGAIFNRFGTMTVGPNVDINNNDARRTGGGVFNLQGELTILDSTIVSNNPTFFQTDEKARNRDGGGIATRFGNLEIRRSRIADNRANEGGGVHVVQSQLVMTDTTISTNTAFRFEDEKKLAEGGGLFLAANGENVTIERSTISDNLAEVFYNVIESIEKPLISTQPVEVVAVNHGLVAGDEVYVESVVAHGDTENSVPRFPRRAYDSVLAKVIDKVDDNTVRVRFLNTDGEFLNLDTNFPVRFFRGFTRLMPIDSKGAAGGGIAIRPNVFTTRGGSTTIRSSSIYGNTVRGGEKFGAGIYVSDTGVFGGKFERDNRAHFSDPVIESSTVVANRLGRLGFDEGLRRETSQFDVIGPLARISNTIIDHRDLYGTEYPSLVFGSESAVDFSQITHNLIGAVSPASTSVFQIGNTQGNLIGDPKLERLADNGGFTETIAFESTDSIALDTGQRDGLLDQRGFPVTDSDFGLRPDVDGQTIPDLEADIGAYESSEVFVQRFDYATPSQSQFGPGEALLIGEGFGDGTNSNVVEKPGFFGLEFGVDRRTVGPGIAKGDLGDKWGAEATVDVDGRIGFEYGYYVNSGSVTTNYEGLISYTTEQDPNNPDEFVIRTGAGVTDGNFFTASPRVGAFLDLVFEFDASIVAEVCVVKCIDGRLDIEVDEGDTIFSLNRQLTDDDGNLLYIAPGGGTTTTKAGNSPALDGNIFFSSEPIENLSTVAENVKDDAEKQLLDQAIDQAGGVLPFIQDLRQIQREAEINLANLSVDKIFADLKAEEQTGSAEELDFDKLRELEAEAREKYEEQVAAEQKKRDDALNEERKVTKKGETAQPKQGAGKFITVSAGQAEGDLLGLEVELAVGFRKGQLNAEKPLGKLAVTVPRIELEDRVFDNGTGRLSATTDDFSNGSDEDNRRQLAALSIDAAAITPLGSYRTNFAGIDIEATTASFHVTPRIKLSQDVSVEPFFDPEHPATFQIDFPDCGSGNVCEVIVSGSGVDGAGTIRSDMSPEQRQISFVPGTKVEVDTNGHKVDIKPSIKMGQRFSNELGLDFDVIGTLRALALEVNAFGEEVLDIGPLIEEEYTLVDDIDFTSIFDSTFNLETQSQSLTSFSLDPNPDSDTANNDGRTPGAAVTLVSGVAVSNLPVTPVQYFEVPLVDSDGIFQPNLRITTSGNQTTFVRPPYEGMKLEVLENGVAVSRFDLPLEGFTFSSGQAPQAFRILGFENLLGSKAIFGLGFNTASSFTIMATAEGSAALTPIGNTTLSPQVIGQSTFIENDYAFDIDGNGVISATTDGELVMRFMEGKTGAQLIDNAVAADATRTSTADIFAHLLELLAQGRLDVDDNEMVEREIDGRLILRHMSGIGSSVESEPALTDQPGDDVLLGVGAKRTLPSAIADFIDVGALQRIEINPNFAKDIRYQTDREPLTENERSVTPGAVSGSSPYVPVLASFTDGVGTFQLNTFGQQTTYLNTFRGQELVQSRAAGTPGRTLETTNESVSTLSEFLALEDSVARADLIDNLQSQLELRTQVKSLGAEEPLFVRLPAANGYEFTLSDPHAVTQLIFDPAVDGNRFLNHDASDFVLTTGGTSFAVSIGEPFALPAGTKTFRLFPLGVPEGTDEEPGTAKFFEAENASPPSLDLNVGLMISGNSATPPTLSASALLDEQANVDTSVQFAPPVLENLPLQVISLEGSQSSIANGDTISVDVFYNVDSAQPTPPPAVLFEVHFDSNRLAFQGMTLENNNVQMVVPGLVNSTTAASPENLEVVPDGDFRTDRTLILSYNDSLGDWKPGETSRQKIATIQFQATTDAKTTTIRTTGLSAAGYALDTTDVLVFGDIIPPTITGIGDQAIAVNTNTGPLPFTISDNETAAEELTVSVSSDNEALVPNLPANLTLAGTGSERTIAVTPAAGEEGTATITLTVTDGVSLFSSESFLLTVNQTGDAPPTITDIADQTTDFETPPSLYHSSSAIWKRRRAR